MARSFDELSRLLPLDPDIEEAFKEIPNELNEYGYDSWGFNPEIAEHLYSMARPFYRYWRPVIRGVENIPAGRVLLVGNHSGQLPWDGFVVSMAALLEGHPPRMLRQMAERWFSSIPFLGEFFQRGGVVVGDPLNCRNLLEAENAILVFPEGSRGCGKPWKDRYKLVDFGRGFMRLALQTNSPIVPFAVIGAEEALPTAFNFEALAKLVGAPYWPIPFHFPLLGPLSYFPLPTRFYVYFGEPMTFEGRHDDVDDVINGKVDVVKARIRSLVDQGLAERESIF